MFFFHFERNLAGGVQIVNDAVGNIFMFMGGVVVQSAIKVLVRQLPESLEQIVYGIKDDNGVILVCLFNGDIWVFGQIDDFFSIQ